MMTSEAGFFLYTLTVALVCVSVYGCIRGIAWVVRNGWRSMLGLVAVRAEAVVDWQDCDRKPCGCPAGGINYSCKPCRAELYGDEQGRTVWDAVDRALVDQPDEVLLTHEAIPEVDEIGAPVMWMALETQCADLADLAEQLGERAS